MRSFDPISLLETNYHWYDSPEKWRAALLDALRKPLGPGWGLVAYRFDAESFDLLDFDCTDPTRAEQIASYVRAGLAQPSHQAAIRSLTPVGLFSHTEEFGAQPAGMDPDYVSVVFPNGEGQLNLITAPSPASAPIRAELRTTWRKLALHFGAGSRLVHGDAPVEAVLTPDGKLLHAEPPAQGVEVQDTLRDFAKHLDRLRARREPRNEAPLDLWTGLLIGRWSLVDRFDSDGRRFVLARRNDPEAPGQPPSLSRRERQVAFYVALGLSNKWVAYALGLSESAIGSHLARILRKLGLDSREALVELRARSEQAR